MAHAHPNQTPAYYQLPTALGVQDKVLEYGPVSLTLRQLVIVLLGGSLTIAAWRSLTFLSRYHLGWLSLDWLRWAIVVVLGLATLVLATIQIAGRMPEMWGLIWLQYCRRPHRYLHEQPSGRARRFSVLFSKSRAVGSVERHYVGLRSLSETMLCLAREALGGTDAVSVLEVAGLNFELKGDADQQLLCELYQSLLAALTFPVQILWRTLPVDIATFLPYQAALAASCASGSRIAWQQLGIDQASFWEHLGQRRPLLERRIYLIVRSQPAAPTLGTTWPFARKPAVSTAEAALDHVRADLERKAVELQRLLNNMNLASRLLEGFELVSFYQSCLTARPIMDPDALAAALDSPDLTTDRLEGALDQGGLTLTAELPRAVDRTARTTHATSPGTMPRLSMLLAPEVIEEHRDYLTVDGEYQRTIVVQGLPRTVHLDWLRPLTRIAVPFELSFLVQPLNSAFFVSRYRRRQMELQSSALLAQSKGGSVDPYVKIAQGDIGALLDQVASGAERVLQFLMVFRVRGATKAELDHRTDTLKSVLGNMQLTARVAKFQQFPGARTCLPRTRNFLLDAGLPLHTQGAATAFPFLATGLLQADGILEGITETGELVILNPWSAGMHNANRLIVGPPGGGKSQKAKADILRQALTYSYAQSGTRAHGQDTPRFQMIVVDPEEEYGRLADAFPDSTIIRIAPGSDQHINPFDLVGPLGGQAALSLRMRRRGDRLADHVQRLQTLLEIMLANRTPSGPVPLTAAEIALLDRAIYATYDQAGITSDPRTHQRLAPLMPDLYRVLKGGACGEDRTDLAGRLSPYVDGSLRGMFEKPTDVELDTALVVFDLHDLEGKLKPAGLFIVSDFVLKRSFQSTIPRQLILDEVATLYQFESGAYFIEDLVRRGRKGYLGVTIITQHPGFLRESAIPANCAVQILMRQEAASLDLIEEMFKLSPREVQALRRLGKGDGLLLVNDRRWLVHFEISELEHLLGTTDPREIAAWLKNPNHSKELERLAALQSFASSAPEGPWSVEGHSSGVFAANDLTPWYGEPWEAEGPRTPRWNQRNADGHARGRMGRGSADGRGRGWDASAPGGWPPRTEPQPPARALPPSRPQRTPLL